MIARHGQPFRRRERRAGGHKRVAHGLVRIRKARDSSKAPKRIEPVRAPREQLPGVGLMPHVPQHTVRLGLEGADERDRQLHRAERRGEVPAVPRHDRENLFPHVRRKRRQAGGVARLHAGDRHFFTSRRFSTRRVVAFWPNFASVSASS